VRQNLTDVVKFVTLITPPQFKNLGHIYHTS